MWILIAQSANDIRREYTFKSEKITIGRETGNTIVLKDLHASRFHAEIYFEAGVGGPAIRDLQSTNGTFVNGEVVADSRILKAGDQIRIGTYLFTLVSSATGTLPAHHIFKSDDTVDNRLLFESLENYAVLVYDFERSLANATDLDAVLAETREFIALSTDASVCHILLKEDFGKFAELELPPLVRPETVGTESPKLIADETVLSQRYKSLIVIPVRVHTFLEALIYVARERKKPRAFDIRDLQLAIAAGHQLALVIQQKRHEQIIIQNVNHDPLTQLPNRNLLRERVQGAINNRKKEPSLTFALLFLDLDDFKLVNDSLGHPAGDDLLVVLAKRFKALIRSSDTIARFGGDEFAVLVRDFKSEAEVSALAKRILEAIREPVTIRDSEIHVSGSIGITTSALEYESANEMIRDADIAMYRAKEQGEPGYEIFNEAMREVILERISLNNDLRTAIQNHEFQLHYQPILSLTDMRIVGFEALIRWQSPHRGFMKPGNFLIETITTGLLRSIDDWVLETACRQATAWELPADGSPPLFISVNLSSKQVGRPDLVDAIDGILNKTGLAPDRLWLEITENTVFGYEKLVIQSMLDLKTLGVHFSLDDFGTGYSTFSYLYRLPIDVLKIDRSFINELNRNEASEKIVHTLIQLGRNLGLRVVAEGIETGLQHASLRDLNCEFGQGYYFSRPLTAAGVESMLEAGGTLIVENQAKIG
jgi:diguanylate cyclase (GGDEF)-like protein